LPHKRSLEKMKMREEAYLTQKAARLGVLNSVFYDRSSVELICTQDISRRDHENVVHINR
jgi:hypothetical protein